MSDFWSSAGSCPPPHSSIWPNISIQKQSRTTPTSQTKFYTQTMFPDTSSTAPDAFCTEFGLGMRGGAYPGCPSLFLDLGISRGGELNQIQSHRMMCYYDSNNRIHLDFLRDPVQKYVCGKTLTNSHLIKHPTTDYTLGRKIE